MNKYFKFFMGASVIALASCSSDEPVNPNEPELPQGEKAYMQVSLYDANDLSRANGYVDGEGNEAAVQQAHFYFFDESGKYIGQSNFTPLSPNGSEPDNIEFKTPALVIIENQKSTEYPDYVVTLINHRQYTDADLNNVSLTDFGKMITNWGDNKEYGFAMATTSYFTSTGSTDAHHDNTYYFATKLNTTDFARTPELAKATPAVKIYVERLAARVELSTSAPDNTFDVQATIYGQDGDNPNVGGNESATKLKVKVLGWYLNGVNEESYLSKQLGSWNIADAFQSTTSGNWAWNNESLYRSFWGMGVGYGALNENSLKFFTYNQKVEVGAKAYCNENTTSYDNLKYTTTTDPTERPNQRLMTSVIVKAKLTDANGNAVPFVEYNGLYFTHDRFINYVLAANQSNIPYIFTEVTTGDVTAGETQTTKKEWKQLDASYFKLEGTNSEIHVALADKFPTAGLKKGNTDDAAEFTDDDKEALIETLKNATSGAIASSADADMYYNVPIAHLNSPQYYSETTEDGTGIKGDLKTWKEGSFGVVRNHAYQININSIKRLGTGVFNPDSNDDKDIITPDPDPKDPNWYLGATINILSWKIVSNNVDL
ncbi:MAG: fimbria major subunit [Clostridium sp.]|nr:fimbria major subunit [Clostridium sp.]